MNDRIGCKCYIYIKFNCSCDVLNSILRNIFSFFSLFVRFTRSGKCYEFVQFSNFSVFEFNAFVIHWKCVRYTPGSLECIHALWTNSAHKKKHL